MDKLTYNAPELALLLGISRSAAYNLMHRADFPSFRIGRRLLVWQDKLIEWLNTQGASVNSNLSPSLIQDNA